MLLDVHFCSRILDREADALGTLSQTPDGRCALRSERRLAHPPAKVWRALTEVDGLRAWFARILDHDRLGRR